MNSDYEILRKIDLSKTAVACYESLFKDGGASVPQLAERLRKPRTGLYRVLKQLETKGFVNSLKTEAQPVYFSAVPISKALHNYAEYQK